MGFYGKHKIIFALFFLICGILISGSINIPKNLLIALTIFTALLSYFKKDIFLMAFFPLAMFLSHQAEINNSLPENLLNKKLSISGKLYKNPEKRETTWRLFINVKEVKTPSQQLKTNIKIVAYSKKPLLNAYYGSSIRIENLKLETLSEFKNPGSFSLKKHFNKKGILYTAFISNPRNIKILGLYEKKDYLLFRINKFRKGYEGFVRSNVSGPESEIINAVTIGAKGAISQKTRKNFSKLGISHLLAISGLHIGAISLFFFFIVKWLLKRSEYLLLMYEVPKIASLITIIPVIFYASLAGFSTPVVRASIMITIYFLSVFFNRDESKINILAAAAIIILLLDPRSFYDLSFRLSFIAVGGIIIFHHFFPFKLNTIKDKLASMLKTTVGATFFTLPLIINNFSYLPVATIPANFFAVPLVEFIIVPTGLLSIIFYPISESVCELLLIFNSKIINMVFYLADYILSFKYSYFTVPNIGNLGYFLFVSTGVLLSLNRFSKKIIYFALITFLGFTLTLIINNNQTSRANKAKIYFLDAGAKYYNLITFQNKKILITGGYSYLSNSDFAENAGVVPFLLKKGVTKIDYLWLLSTDRSHLKGAEAILERINIENIWTNGSKLNDELWKIVREKNIKWKNIRDDLEELHFGDTKISFIKPYVGNQIWNSNEPKPVLIIFKHFGNKALIGEGIEKNYVQNELIKTYENRIKSDAIFISKIENKNEGFIDFINTVKPRAIITNKIKRFSQKPPFDKDLLVTSEIGMVTLYLDKDDLKIENHN